MRQIVQNLKDGAVVVQDVAPPRVQPGHLLIQTTHSLISSGTERAVIDAGRTSLLAKARQQPEKVKQVLDRVRADGLIATVQGIRESLERWVPLGYCNVGHVLEVGAGVEGFSVGDRVVSNGHHAEIVLVPKHLTARIPDEVADEEAAFTVLGSIALQGIRLLGPTLGETIAVFGLGLIGLLAVQILRAHGAKVLGFDFDPQRVELARKYGAIAENLAEGSDPVAIALDCTRQIGVDAVLVTAATQSDDLMHQAAQMSRKRGRIVLTGVTGLNLRRSDFYEKELTFQVSCSYGPGRYDPSYEEQGNDYPIDFVRWTEQRNFEAVLDLMRDGRLSVAELLSLRAQLHEIQAAYDALADKNTIGILLNYPRDDADNARQPSLVPVVQHRKPRPAAGAVVCGLIGAGSFAQHKIIPALVRAGARLKWVATAKGLSGAAAAHRFGIEQSTTDNRQVFDDPEVNAVVIATRHDSHASLVVQALETGKAVFVEKPLCLSSGELETILGAYQKAYQVGPAPPVLMVGYNRRFAPLVTLVRRRLVGRRQPMAMTYTCNAGSLPAGHWAQDSKLGGGRIIGEACHFIDLLHFLADEAPITHVAALRHGAQDPTNLNDTVAITLQLADGSLGQINYFANGARNFPKERLEVFSEGRVLRVDNYRRLESFGCRGPNRRCWIPDKGHNQEFQAFVQAVRKGGDSPISLQSLCNTATAALAALEAIEQQRVVSVDSIQQPTEPCKGAGALKRMSAA